MDSEIIRNHTVSEIVEILGGIPQKEGLHIYLSNNNIQLTYPFRTNTYTILLVTKGSLKLQVNLITHTIKENELISYRPESVTQLLEISTDAKFICVNFSLDFILKNIANKIQLDVF